MPNDVYELRSRMGDIDQMVIEFSRDNSGKMFGSFFLHSIVPENNSSVVAFSILSSSKVPYVINPSCGFIEPGKSQQIGILFPENHRNVLRNGKHFDLNSIDQTILLIKALPINEEYFDHVAK